MHSATAKTSSATPALTTVRPSLRANRANRRPNPNPRMGASARSGFMSVISRTPAARKFSASPVISPMVTAEDCRDFVFRKGTSPRNQINDRLAASNFFNWCVRRQFAATNHMAKVDKPAVDFLEPRTLTLADCRNLLVAARGYRDGLLLP